MLTVQCMYAHTVLYSTIIYTLPKTLFALFLCKGSELTVYRQYTVYSLYRLYTIHTIWFYTSE
jgi:hypothetical protein